MRQAQIPALLLSPQALKRQRRSRVETKTSISKPKSSSKAQEARTRLPALLRDNKTG